MKQRWHMNILLKSPLLSSFSLFFLGSHVPFWLFCLILYFSAWTFFTSSSLPFPCSLVHFKSNLFAVIQRTSSLLRHYPETPKLLQTLSAPELKEIQALQPRSALGVVRWLRDWSARGQDWVKAPFCLRAGLSALCRGALWHLMYQMA